MVRMGSDLIPQAQRSVHHQVERLDEQRCKLSAGQGAACVLCFAVLHQSDCNPSPIELQWRRCEVGSVALY